MWIDDQVIAKCAQDLTVETWIPKQNLVVCGRSNLPNNEVYLEQCESDKVPVLKRYGGGGTVVLHPACVVVSCGLWVKKYYDNQRYFKYANNAVIQCLAQEFKEFENLSQNGISDIVYQDRKVAGTSLFRSRHYMLYQASILVEPRADLMEKYLKHPTKEPKYRGERSHSDFVSGLSSIVKDITAERVLENLREGIMTSIQSNFGDELLHYQKNEIEHLLHKIQA